MKLNKYIFKNYENIHLNVFYNFSKFDGYHPRTKFPMITIHFVPFSCFFLVWESMNTTLVFFAWSYVCLGICIVSIE